MNPLRVSLQMAKHGIGIKNSEYYFSVIVWLL